MARWFLVAALWLGAIAHAGNAASPAPPVPMLWKVCDADNCLYLLGAFHYLTAADYPLSQDVEAAFDDAERLVFEIPPEEMDSPALRRTIQLAAVRRGGYGPDEDLTPALKAKAAAWLDGNASALLARGITPADFWSFRPWYAALLVTLVGLEKAGMQPQLGLDRHFGLRAARAGKPVSGLENAASQIALLSGMVPEEQRQMLGEALDASTRGDAELRKLHEAWRRGDATALAEATLAGLERDYPRLYQTINADRNAAWVPALEQRLQAAGTDDHLVIVGAMHLLGSDGVVEKLRARGHRVRRICAACAGTASD